MNNLKALKGEITPYSVGKDLLEKTLVDVGLEPAGTYERTDEKTIALAGVKILSKQLVLTSESDSESGQNYELKQLEKRIKGTCGKWGFDAGEYLEDADSAVNNNHAW